MSLPEAAVLSLGCTISSTQTEGGSEVASTLTGEALLEDVPEIAKVAEVSATPFHQVPGSELTLEGLIVASEEIEDRIDKGATGVVATPRAPTT